jgi:hypothetical protein
MGPAFVKLAKRREEQFSMGAINELPGHPMSRSGCRQFCDFFIDRWTLMR